MTARTQAFVLLAFAAALLRLGTSDLLLRLVRPSARPWVLLAGAAFAALAVWSLVADAREARRHVRSPGAQTKQSVDAHGHSGATRVAWLVLAPVIAILVTSPQPLGAFSADRQRSAVEAARGAQQTFPPLKGTDPVRVRLFDLASRAVLGGGTTLEGRTLRLVGFVVRGTGRDFVIARLIITCCAADASPVFVRVQAPSGVAFARDTWVEVTGRYVGISTTDPDTPVVRASAIRATGRPENPYD